MVTYIHMCVYIRVEHNIQMLSRHMHMYICMYVKGNNIYVHIYLWMYVRTYIHVRMCVIVYVCIRVRMFRVIEE